MKLTRSLIELLTQQRFLARLTELSLLPPKENWPTHIIYLKKFVRANMHIATNVQMRITTTDDYLLKLP